LAMASPVRAGERRHDRERLRLGTPAVFELLGPAYTAEPRPLPEVRWLDEVVTHDISLPPLFSLLVPPAATKRADGSDASGPMLAFGARIQGRNLVAFTRAGARTDPESKVVYQRLV